MTTPEKAIKELRFLAEQYKILSGKEKPWNRCREIKEALEFAIEAINEQRADGEWIPEEETFTDLNGTIETYTRFACSRCNQANGWGQVPFCPWCGAKNKNGERRHDELRETDPEQRSGDQEAK